MPKKGEIKTCKSIKVTGARVANAVDNAAPSYNPIYFLFLFLFLFLIKIK